MSNHYHLLIETPKANLSKGMHFLNSTHSQKFNMKYGRTGHLFQGRYKGIVVEKDSYLLELSRYIVLNPVRAKIVNHPKKWQWSSYLATCQLASIPWLQTKWILSIFGENEETAINAYKNFIDDGLVTTSDPLKKIKNNIFLGSDEFIKKVNFQINQDKLT